MSAVGIRYDTTISPIEDLDPDDRRTPIDVFNVLHSVRAFTVDAAASVENALLPTFWTLDTDGLSQSWRGHRVWCNPPFSHIEPWIVKAWSEMQDHACESVTMLLPANRCEQPFWQHHVEPYRDRPAFGGVRLSVRFLAGRLAFGPMRPKREHAPFGCVLLAWDRAA